MRRGRLLVLCLSLLQAACSFGVSTIQGIEIAVYPDADRNAELAGDLLHYDWGYVADHVPGLNSEMLKKISVGAKQNRDSGKVSILTTYRQSVGQLGGDLEAIKSDFEAFYHQQAALHASREAQFDQLAPKGARLLNTMINGPADQAWREGSRMLRDALSLEQFTQSTAQAYVYYGGKPTKTLYTRGLYYAGTAERPDVIALLYVQNFASGKRARSRVRLTQGDDGEWLLAGFKVEPLAGDPG